MTAWHGIPSHIADPSSIAPALHKMKNHKYELRAKTDNFRALESNERI